MNGGAFTTYGYIIFGLYILGGLLAGCETKDGMTWGVCEIYRNSI